MSTNLRHLDVAEIEAVWRQTRASIAAYNEAMDAERRRINRRRPRYKRGNCHRCRDRVAPTRLFCDACLVIKNREQQRTYYQLRMKHRRKPS